MKKPESKCKKQEQVDEGARSFTRFFEQIGDGSAAEEATKALHELNKRLQLEDRAQGKLVKGEMTIKISLGTEDGTTAVAYTIDTKAPAPRRPGSIFFFTRGGNLTVENQRQLKLGLREVGSESEPVEVEEQEQEAREV